MTRGDRITDETAGSGAASLGVALIAAAWGLYWLPVRALDDAGLGGAWGTVAITGLAALSLAPFALRQYRAAGRADPLALAAIALGGAAFALYSIGFLYGRVAIVVLFYLLTPVWSTLLARFAMGWAVPRLRWAALALGLGGLVLLLGPAEGAPLPRDAGEWLGLVAGFLWSVATVGMRARPAVPPALASAVMAAGGAATALILAPVFGPAPVDVTVLALPVAWATGVLWYGVLMLGLMWAAARLDPARVGILLMAEVLVGAVSAAWLAGEWLTGAELAGGALIVAAGIVEMRPARAPRMKRRSRAGP